MVGALLTNKSPVTLDQTTPIARLTAEYEAIVVPADSPIKNAKDLAAAIKADPAQGDLGRRLGRRRRPYRRGLFAKAAGADPTKINYIPFSGGGEALAAILGGKVTAGISGYGEFESQIKAGKLRLHRRDLGHQAAERRRPVPQGTGRRSRDRQLARGRGPSRHHRGPEEGPDRHHGQAGKSKEWTEILKAKGWDDAYLSGDAFAKFLADDQVRTKDVLTSVGLVK